jgi:cytochrome c biogenesis protein CcdA
MSEQEYNLSETTGDTDRVPPAGRSAMFMAGLAIGIMLMGIQLWLLTLALDLYLSGDNTNTWQLVLISGLVFLGGIWLMRLLSRHPHTAS